MSKQVIKGRPLWLGNYSLSKDSSALAIDYAAETPEATNLDSITREYLPGGLKSVGIALEGMSDYAIDRAEVQLFADVAAGVVFTTATVTGAEGERSFILHGQQMNHNPIKGAVGDIAGFSASFAARDSLIPATLELTRANRSSSGNSTGRQLGAVAAASNKVHSAMHVVDVSGTNPTLDVIVQSDDNGSFTSAVSRLTFAQATGITSEYLSLVGPITDDYWRVNFTIGGSTPSFTFVVSIGIL